jgi:hypothetical protein
MAPRKPLTDCFATGRVTYLDARRPGGEAMMTRIRNA